MIFLNWQKTNSKDKMDTSTPNSQNAGTVNIGCKSHTSMLSLRMVVCRQSNDFILKERGSNTLAIYINT